LAVTRSESRGGARSAGVRAAVGRLDVTEVYAMIDALGDIGQGIKGAQPDS
jgi:hypothetical protein